MGLAHKEALYQVSSTFYFYLYLYSVHVRTIATGWRTAKQPFFWIFLSRYIHLWLNLCMLSSCCSKPTGDVNYWLALYKAVTFIQHVYSIITSLRQRQSNYWSAHETYQGDSAVMACLKVINELSQLNSHKSSMYMYIHVIITLTVIYVTRNLSTILYSDCITHELVHVALMLSVLATSLGSIGYPVSLTNRCWQQFITFLKALSRRFLHTFDSHCFPIKPPPSFLTDRKHTHTKQGTNTNTQ